MLKTGRKSAIFCPSLTIMNEYDKVYKLDKKYNIPKRTTIGKKCEDDDATILWCKWNNC